MTDHIAEVVYQRMNTDNNLWAITGRSRHALIRGLGVRNSRVMVIAGVPTSQEVVHRLALKGPVGAVTRDLMETAGLFPDGDLRNCFYTHAVKWQYRTALQYQHVEEYRPWLKLEWQAIGEPPFIVTIGSLATRLIDSTIPPLSQSAGNPILRKGGRMTVWPMLDPLMGEAAPTTYRDRIEKDWENLGAWLKASK